MTQSGATSFYGCIYKPTTSHSAGEGRASSKNPSNADRRKRLSFPEFEGLHRMHPSWASIFRKEEDGAAVTAWAGFLLRLQPLHWKVAIVFVKRFHSVGTDFNHYRLQLSSEGQGVAVRNRKRHGAEIRWFIPPC